MDIDLMVLNVGNSRLAIGIFVSGKLEYVTRVPHERKADWADAIGEAWEKIRETERPAVVGASVNPPLMEPLEHVVSEVTGQGMQWVGREIDWPMKVLTENPKETGVDRIVNLAAAFEQMGKGCVVVDAGTAMTVDCCNDAGEFLGGAIGPGVRMILDALHEKTAKLPRVELARPGGAFGKSTAGAIQAGIYYGARGFVREAVENYATELGYWPDVIATGGDAKELFEGWDVIHAVAPDLTLYGTALAFTKHLMKRAEGEE